MIAGPDAGDQHELEVSTRGGHTQYHAPTRAVELALEVAGLEGQLRLIRFGHVDKSIVILALEEFGR